MALISTMTMYLTALNSRRLRRRERLYLSELPSDLRKDLGWPSDSAAQTRICRRVRAIERPQ